MKQVLLIVLDNALRNSPENGHIEVAVVKQKALPLVYKDVKLEAGYRIDLIVENCIIIEIKAVDQLSDIHLAQILTYLKLSNCKLGLLVNFNVRHLKDGIKRVVL